VSVCLCVCVCVSWRITGRWAAKPTGDRLCHGNEQPWFEDGDLEALGEATGGEHRDITAQPRTRERDSPTYGTSGKRERDSKYEECLQIVQFVRPEPGVHKSA